MFCESRISFQQQYFVVGSYVKKLLEYSQYRNIKFALILRHLITIRFFATRIWHGKSFDKIQGTLPDRYVGTSFVSFLQNKFQHEPYIHKL